MSFGISFYLAVSKTFVELVKNPFQDTYHSMHDIQTNFRGGHVVEHFKADANCL